MRSKYLLVATWGVLILVGAGCSSKTTLNQNNATTTSNVTVQEPQYNTPILQEKDPEYIAKNDAYFFIVENKENNLGNTVEYAILSVRKNCDSFGLIFLTKDQPLNLGAYKNKPFLWKKYEVQNGEYMLKEIEADPTSKQEIENFKKTCPDPFGRYMVSSAPLTGLHLYVESLDQSSTNVLAAIKAINVVEYKPAEFTDKNQIKTLFLTVPNSKFNELEALLQKEANDKIVYGAKILFGDLGGEIERAEFGTTNFEIKLIAVSALN